MSKHNFLWFDCETTGLDPAVDSMLEWAVLLVEDGADGDMSIVERYSGVINPWNEAESAIPFLDERVRDMHTKNGLLLEILQGRCTSAEEVEDFLIDLAKELTNSDEPRDLVLAGAGPAFDLAFLRIDMPRFAKCLHYRTFDVRTLQMAEQLWNGGAPIKSIATSKTHRALDDITEAVEIAKAHRARVYGGGK